MECSPDAEEGVCEDAPAHHDWRPHRAEVSAELVEERTDVTPALHVKEFAVDVIEVSQDDGDFGGANPLSAPHEGRRLAVEAAEQLLDLLLECEDEDEGERAEEGTDVIA